MVDAKKMLERFEQVYQEEKNRESEELHNALAEVIAEKKATIQNTLFVLEMLRFELLRAKYEQLMGHAIVPAGGGLKKDAKLTTEEAK
jgi:hypothetical protein